MTDQKQSTYGQEQNRMFKMGFAKGVVKGQEEAMAYAREQVINEAVDAFREFLQERIGA